MYAGRIVEARRRPSCSRGRCIRTRAGCSRACPSGTSGRARACARSRARCPTRCSCRRAAASARAARGAGALRAERPALRRGRRRAPAGLPLPGGGPRPRRAGRHDALRRSRCAGAAAPRRSRLEVTGLQALPRAQGPARARGGPGQGGRRRHPRDRARGRDARAGRRVGLRQDHGRPHASCASSSRARARCASTAWTCAPLGRGELRLLRRRHADHLPGPVLLAEPAHDGRPTSSARPARPPARAGRAALAGARARAAGRGRPRPGATRNRYPHEFSGGQRQRIGIARAPVARAALHRVRRGGLRPRRLDPGADPEPARGPAATSSALAYLFIAHDLSVVRHIADRVAVMYLGRIVETADAEALFSDAQAPVHRGAAARPCPSPIRRGAARASCWAATCPRR